MYFAHPQMLWLLGVTLPLLVAFLWWGWRKRQQLIAQFVQSRLLAQLTVGVSRRRQRWRLVLLVLAVACLLLALARPQWGFDWEEAHQRGLDILVALDTSRSMLAADVAPSRLARAKLAILDLMQVARSDRLGLIAFAGTAFLQCPLTLDDEAFRQSVHAVEVGIIPQGGTALARAIAVALETFKVEEDNVKVLIFFTDGEDHDGEAVQAAERAAAAGLRIFMVGVGTPQGEVLRVRDEKGTLRYVKDLQGQPVTSKLNESLLQAVAAAGDGQYLALRGARPMETLYETQLAPLPRAELTARLIRQAIDRFQWPLGLGVLLLLAELFFPERRRALRPEAIATGGHEALQKLAAVLILATLPLAAQASARQAVRAYDEGRFRDAQLEYERLLEAAPKDARLHYNAGTAAYRAQGFDTAARHFRDALQSEDLALQQKAFYNLGNALFRQGERATDPAAKTKDWEEALRQYDGALKLDPQDADAQFNRDLVAKLLEQLKQQQQQQQQQQKQPSKDPQQDDQKKDAQQKQPPAEDQQPDAKPSDQNQNRDPQGQDQPTPSQDKQNQAQQEQSDPQQQQQPQQPQQPGAEDRQERAEAAPQDAANPPPDQPTDAQAQDAANAAAAALGQMTPEQARQLLEAARNNEKILLFQPAEKPGQPRARSVKDW